MSYCPYCGMPSENHEDSAWHQMMKQAQKAYEGNQVLVLAKEAELLGKGKPAITMHSKGIGRWGDVWMDREAVEDWLLAHNRGAAFPGLLYELAISHRFREGFPIYDPDSRPRLYPKRK